MVFAAKLAGYERSLVINMINTKVTIAGVEFKNPVMTASGTYGYSDEFDAFLNVKNLGAIVTKGVTLEVRPGNEGRRIFETEAGMINRIGLENVGIEAFLSDKLPKLKEKGIIERVGSDRKGYWKINNGVK